MTGPLLPIHRVHDQPWYPQAKCRGMDPNLFHPEQYDKKTTIKAQTVCRACPVQLECLDFAQSNHEFHGIWGAQTARVRMRMRGAAARGDAA